MLSHSLRKTPSCNRQFPQQGANISRLRYTFCGCWSSNDSESTRAHRFRLFLPAGRAFPLCPTWRGSMERPRHGLLYRRPLPHFRASSPKTSSRARSSALWPRDAGNDSVLHVLLPDHRHPRGHLPGLCRSSVELFLRSGFDHLARERALFHAADYLFRTPFSSSSFRARGLLGKPSVFSFFLINRAVA